MTTYNIYQCECGFVMDCEHAISLSLNIECPTCHKRLKHAKQITMDILEDWLS
jgi:predicted nucleic acid-binding Zn ribbon protein